MTPEVSVIIPTFNRALFLARAIRSVLAQTYRSYEIIVIDDASPDNTAEVIKDGFKRELEFGRLRYVKNETNLERTRSRNKGVSLAKGKYIAFLDDDDIWLADHLQTLISFLGQNKQVSCVFGKFIWLYKDGSVEDKFIRDFPEVTTGSGDLYKDMIFKGRMVASSCVLLYKSVYEKLNGYREDLAKVNEDWEFFSRVAMNFEVGYVNNVSCLMYSYGESLSIPNTGEGAFVGEQVFKIIEENSLKYKWPINVETRSFVYMTLSGNFIPYMAKSREYLFKAIKARPAMIFSCSVLGLLLRTMLGEHLYVMLRDLDISIIPF